MYLIKPRNLSDIREGTKYFVQSLHEKHAFGLLKEFSHFKHLLTLEGIELGPMKRSLSYRNAYR